METCKERLRTLRERPHDTISNNGSREFAGPTSLLSVYTKSSDTASVCYMHHRLARARVKKCGPYLTYYFCTPICLHVACDPIIASVWVPLEFAKRFWTGISLFYPYFDSEHNVQIKTDIAHFGFNPSIFRHMDEFVGLREVDILGTSRVLPTESTFTLQNERWGEPWDLQYTEIFGTPYIGLHLIPFTPRKNFCITFYTETVVPEAHTKGEFLAQMEDSLVEFYLEVWYPRKLRKRVLLSYLL